MSQENQENVELAYRAYDAFNRRDLDAFLACMDPEVEFTTRFMQMENKAYDRGHAGIRDWWRDTFAVFPDYRAEILEVRYLGDAGIAAVRMRGHGADSGAPFDERCGTRSSCVTARSSGGASSRARPKPSDSPAASRASAWLAYVSNRTTLPPPDVSSFDPA